MFSILFDEKEEHDAEISWKDNGRTGGSRARRLHRSDTTWSASPTGPRSERKQQGQAAQDLSLSHPRGGGEKSSSAPRRQTEAEATSGMNATGSGSWADLLVGRAHRRPARPEIAWVVVSRNTKDGPSGPLWFDVLFALGTTVPLSRGAYPFGAPATVGVVFARAPWSTTGSPERTRPRPDGLRRVRAVRPHPQPHAGDRRLGAGDRSLANISHNDPKAASGTPSSPRSPSRSHGESVCTRAQVQQAEEAKERLPTPSGSGWSRRGSPLRTSARGCARTSRRGRSQCSVMTVQASRHVACSASSGEGTGALLVVERPAVRHSPRCGRWSASFTAGGSAALAPQPSLETSTG